MRFLDIFVIVLAVCLLPPMSVAFAVTLDTSSLLTNDSKLLAGNGRWPHNAFSFRDRIMFGARMVPSAYSHCLHAFPLATESVTAGVMASLGDYLAQSKQQGKSVGRKQIDFRRNLNFILKGLGEGVLWSFWYRLAENWSQVLTQGFLQRKGLPFPANPFIVKILHTIISVGLDVLLACPFIYVCWDIPFLSLASGKSVRQIPSEIQKKLRPMLRASLMLWTPVNVVIYNVPLEYRVMLSSVADVVWQSIMSVIVVGPTHDDTPEMSEHGPVADAMSGLVTTMPEQGNSN